MALHSLRLKLCGVKRIVNCTRLYSNCWRLHKTAFILLNTAQKCTANAEHCTQIWATINTLVFKLLSILTERTDMLCQIYWKPKKHKTKSKCAQYFYKDSAPSKNKPATIILINQYWFTHITGLSPAYHSFNLKQKVFNNFF